MISIVCILRAGDDKVVVVHAVGHVGDIMLHEQSVTRRLHLPGHIPIYIYIYINGIIKALEGIYEESDIPIWCSSRFGEVVSREQVGNEVGACV